MLDFILRPFARVLIAEAIRRGPELREAFGLPDLTDLDDQIVAKLPDLSDLDQLLTEKIPDFAALANQIVTAILSRIPFLGGVR